MWGGGKIRERGREGTVGGEGNRGWGKKQRVGKRTKDGKRDRGWGRENLVQYIKK